MTLPWQPETGCMQCSLRETRQIEGITGTIKNLWEDFHVREIRKDGSICQLEELISTNDLRKARLEEVYEESGKAILANVFELSEEQKEILLQEGHLASQDLEVLTDWLNLIRQFRLESLRNTNERNDGDGSLEKIKRQQDATNHMSEKDPEEMEAIDAKSSEDKGRQKRDEDEIEKWGVTTEFLRKELRRCHCLLIGKNGTSDKQILKQQRKESHDVIRGLLPFILSDTLTTADAYEAQNERDGPISVSVGHEQLDGETREALQLKRQHFPTALVTRFHSVELKERTWPKIILNDLPDMAAESYEEDRFRFIRITLRPACIAWLLGRPLDSPALTRFNWFTDARWPKKHPAYLHFVLHKTNKDTSEAISRIAACVGCRPKCFGFAGTKDKRGITCQMISAFKVSIEQLKSAMTKKEWDRQLRCSSFEYKHYRMKLGYLHGNHFKLAIRDIPLSHVDRIPALCEHFDKSGFLNYFGMQRFGTGKIKTWQIGAVLLSKQYESAVRLILGDVHLRDKLFGDAFEKQQSVDEHTRHGEGETNMDESAEAESKVANAELDEAERASKKRKLDLKGLDWYIKGDNIARALRETPKWCYNERLILESLQKESRSFISALLRLTKTSLGLYCHAAQSIVWNAMVSRRVEEFGHDKVVVGDIVKVKEIAEDKVEDEEMEEKQVNSEVYQPETDECVATGPKWEITVVDSQEMADQYDIFDVLLPLPGENVQYPPYLREAYEKCCSDLLKIQLDDFRSDKHGLCHLSGSYRPLLQKADHVAYRVLLPGQYDNVTFPRRPVLASDADRLLGKEIAIKDTFTDFLKPLQCVLENPLSEIRPACENAAQQRTETAVLLLSCSLPRSCYLTSAIREIIHGDFSSNSCSSNSDRLTPRHEARSKTRRGGFQRRGGRR